ncbi:hypothetical protein HN51_058001 [Arachis hypogaea]|uniref:C2H2-type domain-containing protein n=3 Tax=Arachis TaxID=3817 RepID=A0A444WYY2_ARAHY|nr:uncharacterized protein LOC112782419 [Arachis hypogaea]QHN81141.1 Methyl-CpG-binding domain-containing protein [Arachis hypogaea]RYQ82667.1 hypothetical protein Ahy_B10g101243 [Arachis hypogaea]
MATATAATSQLPAPPPQQQFLNLESLARIDTTTLSQSELHALSLSSLSAFDLHSTRRHLVTPKIDPSLFNESAGSRRQTYSRPRRPESSPTGRRRRVAGLLPAAKLPSLPSDDLGNAENRVIIDYLKQFIREDPKFDQVVFAPPSSASALVAYHGGGAGEGRGELAMVKFGERKRKRGRKPKVKVNLEESYSGMEIVNKNGVVINLMDLAKAEDPFAEELRRRTDGLQGEEELLGFLRDLEGQWGSRRRKRRIVDAANFGDALPLGWKLILGLKRKDGRAWIYCRRYISPSGQQFMSCREVASYLQSLIGHSDAPLQIGHRSENLPQEQRAITEHSAGVAHEDQREWQIVVANSDVPSFSVSNERGMELALLGLENLADVEIHDLFECHKCNVTFDEKDSYLQHLLSFHQRTTRRYRLGSSLGDGVIIKDGKFECQFCHKVFSERRRYSSHVGIHVRSNVRQAEDSSGLENVQRTDKSPVREDMLLSRISRMDALIEIAQSSIMEDCDMEPASKVAACSLDQDINFESEQQMEDSLNGTNVVQVLNQQDSPELHMDVEEEETDDDSQVIDAKMVTCLDHTGLLCVNEKNGNPSVEVFDKSGIDMGGASQDPLLILSCKDKISDSGENENFCCSNIKEKFKFNEDNNNKNELEIGSDGCKDVPVRTNVQEMLMPASEENVIDSRVSKSPISQMQSLYCSPAFSSDKVGKQSCTEDHEYKNVERFQELDEISTTEHDATSIQDSFSLPDVQTDMVNKTVMETTYPSSVQVESQEVMQLTTVCVWCGIEFNHDALNSEIQPDSVGFMCPACKAKISGQINVLDS